MVVAGGGGGGAGALVVGAGAAAVVTTADGLASVGLGEGEGDSDGVGLGDPAVVATTAGMVGLGFPPPIAAAIAVPPQHSTRNASMMPMIRPVLPTFFFGGWAGGTDG